MKVHVEPVSAIVMDIEGTTSSARHVYEVLFPYARAAMATWVEQHGDEPVTRKAIAEVAEQLGVESTDTAAIVAQLVQWIDDDVKAAPLKTLQGLIWQEGYSRGELTSHMFDDVPPTLRTWHIAGIPLVIYSSGSVAAQKALFAHAPDGDLDSLIGANFDITTAGPKRERDSYTRIAQALNAKPEQLLFLSDIQAELDAARAAGWQVVGVLREGETQATASGAPLISSFTELEVLPASEPDC
ncbi:MAG: acireductone synthase [Candidatus Nanopelagicales bacterium]|jgi:enolase-phosphatase E1|nr:acireductone synthase [Candidatus Nanopelagicales bacterium]